jgi:hypothetical protein
MPQGQLFDIDSSYQEIPSHVIPTVNAVIVKAVVIFCPQAILSNSVTEAVIFLKNAVFWDVTPCGPCKNQRVGGA